MSRYLWYVCCGGWGGGKLKGRGGGAGGESVRSMTSTGRSEEVAVELLCREFVFEFMA